MQREGFVSRYIRIASILCAIMVIGLHAYNVADLDPWSFSARIIGSLSHGLFIGAVPMFFIMSGFLFFRGVQSIKTVFEKQKRRILTLVVPFFTWSTVYCVLYYGFNYGEVLANHKFGLFDILQEILFYKYVFPMWFMFQLILFMVITPLLYCILKNKKIALAILTISAILGIFDIHFSVNVVGETRTIFAFNYFFYFFLGCYFSFFKSNVNITHIRRIPYWAIITEVLAFSVLEGIVFDTTKLFNRRLLVPFIVVGLAVFIAKMAYEPQTNRFSALILSIPTMIVYGVHQLVETVLYKALQIFSTFRILSFFIVFFLSVVISCAIAFIIKKFKPLNVVFNGNRL